MWSMLFGLITGLPGLAGKFLDWQVQKANVTLEGFKVGAQIDVEAYKAYLGALVETNRMKQAANAWWGAKLIILTAGWPCALHLAAIMMDSLPFPYIIWDTYWFSWQAHAIGSWGIPKPPAPYDDYQSKIVLSFFIIMPAMPLVSAASTWLASRK